MSKEHNTSRQSRRDFLKGAATAGGAVAVVAVTGGKAMAVTEEKNTEIKPRSSGYRETQHIRDYYRSADK